MVKHYNISITGRVQGVGFRYNTKLKALELGINGFVQNKNSRSVYIEAEGDESKLNEFLAWCKIGPRQAMIESFSYSESNVEMFGKFSIRH